jgi:hypothetical protein
MKTDLSKVKVGDKIWSIQEGWKEVISTSSEAYAGYPIETENSTYTIDGKVNTSNKYPSAFLEYPFKDQPIEKDTLVWCRNGEDFYWAVGYYSHFEDGRHFVFSASKKSTETNGTTHWNIVTTENPLL